MVERRYAEIKKPFRGTRQRPTSTWATATIPTDEEIERMISEAEPVLRAAIAIASETALRVGALPELIIGDGGEWWTVSKGKKVMNMEPLSAWTLSTVKVARLDRRAPFAPESFPIKGKRRRAAGPMTKMQVTARLQMMMQRLCERLVKEGKLSAVFSFHDLRHAFAQRNVGQGLLWLRDRLGHAAVSHYLQNTLNVNTAKM